MNKALRIVALAIAVVGLVGWLIGGRNPGWTKTSVSRMVRDPVTEIDYPETEKKFVPGVELLGAVLLGAGGLFAASFLFRKK